LRYRQSATAFEPGVAIQIDYPKIDQHDTDTPVVNFANYQLWLGMTPVTHLVNTAGSAMPVATPMLDTLSIGNTTDRHGEVKPGFGDPMHMRMALTLESTLPWVYTWCNHWLNESIGDDPADNMWFGDTAGD